MHLQQAHLVGCIQKNAMCRTPLTPCSGGKSVCQKRNVAAQRQTNDANQQLTRQKMHQCAGGQSTANSDIDPTEAQHRRHAMVVTPRVAPLHHRHLVLRWRTAKHPEAGSMVRQLLHTRWCSMHVWKTMLKPTRNCNTPRSLQLKHSAQSRAKRM